ncbi:MAG: phospho-sugar mutase [Bacteroidales bacterium]
MEIDKQILERAKVWLGSDFDPETRQQVENMIQNDPKELTESFYRDLEFGTGGLRGIMGVGTNRMNKYTVGMATQGLANYVKKSFPGQQLKAAIAYDCRNNSQFFAQITAEILSANGFKVYLFDQLRPTPELSFAIRHHGCHTGIVITASHNPKEYNGYKVYWNDGGQLVAPHDTNVIEEVLRIKGIGEVNFNSKSENITPLGEETDKAYISELVKQSLSPQLIKKHSDTCIVFTPIHGTCVDIVPSALKAYGFTNLHNVPEQDVTSGDFPTVHSPNPEEPAALEMALTKAREIDAELVMATDPDGDRVGIAVKNPSGEFELLNGNQTASLIIFYLLTKWKETGKLQGKEYIVKTIVTTELLREIAASFQTECYDVLTGFKFIAEIIRKLEGQKQFIGGGEESYGYLVGDYARDKDAVVACCIIAETLVWAKESGKSLYELLIDIYLQFGFFKEKLLSITRKGKEGMEEIQQMMENFRNTPPTSLNGSRVLMIKDYKESISRDLQKGTQEVIDMPRSNVLQFFLEDGSKITMRPSGTEPKIKFYFGTRLPLARREDFEAVNQEIDLKLDQLMKSLNL